MDFRALPKVELHRHLEGSVRFSTFVELAREVRLDLSTSELRRQTSMRGEKPGFRRFLSKFALFRGLYPSREWIERVAFEAVEDARREGVIYLELRFSPTHFGRRMKAQGEDVADWVARGARRAGIDVRFVATFGRDFGPRGNEPTSRAVEGTNVFSGLDLAGDESKSALPFRSLFRRLKLPATLHAGEARDGAGGVREALRSFGATRIGHGVRCVADRQIVEFARAQGVTFEVCLTSELLTGAAGRGRTHAARLLADRGARVTLCTDDPSVCGTDLPREYRLARRLGWSSAELLLCNLTGASAAFAPEEHKRLLRLRLIDAWKKFPARIELPSAETAGTIPKPSC